MELTLTEIIPTDRLKKLLRSKKIDNIDKVVDKPERATSKRNRGTRSNLESLQRHAKTGSHEVIYTQSAPETKPNGEKLGRLYPRHPSLQSLNRHIRGYLAEGIYVDVDIVNCFPELLRQKCKWLKIACPCLAEYCANRDVHLEELVNAGLTREDAKGAFTYVINGQKLPHLLAKHNLDGADVPFLAEYAREMQDIHTDLEQRTVFQKFIKRGEQERPSNVIGHAMTFFLQEIERQVAYAMITCLQDTLGYEVGTLIHDGCLVKTNALPDDDLRDVEMHILAKTNYNVALKVKPFNYDKSLLFDDDDEGSLNDPSDSQLCIESMKQWAKQLNLYKVDVSGKVQCIQYNDTTPYWATMIYKDIDEIVKAWARSLHQEMRVVYEKNFVHNHTTLVKWIEKQDCVEFPFVKYSQMHFGYKDGVFNIETNKFTPTAELDDKKLFCRNYFDVPFAVKRCEHLHKVFTYQELDEDTIEDFYALMGRLYFPIKRLDDWQLFPMIKGAPGCGKSVAIEFVQNTLRPGAHSTIDFGTSQPFALQGKNDAEVVIIPDASEDMQKVISSDVMKKMPCGEMVDINIKGKAPKTEQWTTPIMFGCNNWIGYKGDWTIRRFVLLIFMNVVPEEERDTTLSTKIKEQAPFMLPYVVNSYHKMLDKARSKSFWDVCSQYYREQRDDNATIEQPLLQFLNAPRTDKGYWVEYNNGSRIEWEDFLKAYQGFCKGVLGIHKATLNYTTDVATIMSVGFRCVRKDFCSKCKKSFSTACCSNEGKKRRRNKPSVYDMVIHKPSYAGDGVIRDSPHERDPLDDGLNEFED
jgi:hypothetical protein